MPMFLYAALLVVGVTLLAIVAVRALIGGVTHPRSPTPAKSSRPTPSGSAQHILEERYAAGELSTDEFQHRLRVINGGDR